MSSLSIPRLVRLPPESIRFVQSWLGPPEQPGLLALRHALDFPRPTLWCDDRLEPRSVLYVRPGVERLEAFGAGEPGPVIDWLARQTETFILHASLDWHKLIQARFGPIKGSIVETWTTGKPIASGSSAIVKRLTRADASGFEAVAPKWGLSGWLTFGQLIKNGAAFGVPHGEEGGFASVAWVFDQAGPYDSIGVATEPRFQRLGLGRASASALVDHIINVRHKQPLWSAGASNEPSLGLAKAMGFSRVGGEVRVHWPNPR